MSDETTTRTHGTLTAEQVREAIFNGSSYASYDGAKYYADGIHMQAIADELNARAERTCKQSRMFNLIKRECDGEHYSWRGDEMPNYCPECGARIEVDE